MFYYYKIEHCGEVRGCHYTIQNVVLGVVIYWESM